MILLKSKSELRFLALDHKINCKKVFFVLFGCPTVKFKPLFGIQLH